MTANVMTAYTDPKKMFLQQDMKKSNGQQEVTEFGIVIPEKKEPLKEKQEVARVIISEDGKLVSTKEGEDKKLTGTQEKKEEEAVTGEAWRRGKSKEEQRIIEHQIRTCQHIDAKVKAHEQAHKGAGGQYTGAVSYQKNTGPDGKQYAVGGEVSISVSEEPTAEGTIAKMQVVKRAALAPADPSSQDRMVAAAASNKEMEARAKLREEQLEKTAEIAKKMPKPGKTPDIEDIKIKNPKIFKEEEVKHGIFKGEKAKKQEPWAGWYVDFSA